MINLKKTDNQEQLRELLEFIVNRLYVTQVNLSKWMDVSRPLVNKFLKDKTTEDDSKPIKLPIKREGLIRFCEQLTSDTSDLNEEDLHAKWTRTDSQQDNNSEINPLKLRLLFGEIGVDELLETAGLLPEHTQVIRVTPERFVSVAQIAALFELLTLEELIATTQGVVSIISSKVFAQTTDNSVSDDALDNLIKTLEEPYQDIAKLEITNNPWKYHPILGVKRRIEIVDKLKKASKHLRAIGKTKFTQKEAVSLFLSIAIKEQIPNYSNNIHLRVHKFDVRTISHVITWEDAKRENYSDVYQQIIRCVYIEECQLKNPDCDVIADFENELFTSKRLSLDFFEPVRMTVITSSFGIESKNTTKPSRYIEWTYNSSSSILENSISACGLLLGIAEDGAIADVITNTKALDGSMNSLVETSVILDQKYQGIWVDHDSNIAILQAFVSAAKQWLNDRVNKGEIDLNIYVHTCTVLSEMRIKLSTIRQRFQNFEFVNENDESLADLVEIKKQKTIGDFDELRLSLHNLAKDAMHELAKIPVTKIYFLLRLSLFRCYFLAKLLLLRLENFQGNLSNAKDLIAEIETELNADIDVKNNLIPIQAFLQIEKILFELSLGNSVKLFQKNSEAKFQELETWKNKIFSAIKPGTFYKDPGIDIYHALSEIYGNYARIELYLSDDRETLEKTVDNFLRAAHYALRIGYKQRASRWFTLAGRVWLRLDNEQMCKQALKIAKKLTLSSLTTWHDYNLRQAICSEISLLEGEILLVIENQPVAALDWYLKALKGAIYLRLKRRMGDALIGISRCSQQIGDRSVKNDLEPIFSSLSAPDNRSTEIVFNLINNLRDREDNPRWSSVSEEFAIAAAQIWQDWHDLGQSQLDQLDHIHKSTSHPIATKIKNGTIYAQVSRRQ